MIILLYARSQNNVFGAEGKLPWYVPEDLAFFKQVTEGHTVIMGHKTWLSLPRSARPLPNRENLVLSRTVKSVRGGKVFVSLEDALIYAEDAPKVFVIGGVEVLRQAMARAEAALVTTVMTEVKQLDNTIYAPELSLDLWRINHREYKTSSTGVPFTHETYRKMRV